MYSIGKFAKKTGLSISTLRNWDRDNKLKPIYKADSGYRYYSEEQLSKILNRKIDKEKINIGYVRVSTRKQKDDLERQYELMELYLTQQGTKFKIISDIGSGINYNKNGLRELLKLITTNEINNLYLMNKDRLLRFGYELVKELCDIHNVKIEIINQSENKTDEEEMIDDILNIIHVFSCKMNDKRSHINKKIMEKLKNEK